MASARTVIPLLAAALCLGAVESELPEARNARSFLFENVASVAVFGAIALGLVAWSLRMIRQRLAERRADEAQAAMMFEAQFGDLLAGRQPPLDSGAVALAPDSSGPIPVAPAPGGENAAEPMAVPSAAPASAPAPGTVPAVDDLLAKLRAGGLFGGLEGSLYLSDGQSEGKIVRLTDGKMAVVLPHLESAEWMARQLKRFDLCIVALGGGQACVVSPLGEFIASRFSL